MNRLSIFVVFLFFISCNPGSSHQEQFNAEGTAVVNMVEGKDYVILKRFRLQDNQGFAQPMEASW